MHNETSGAFYNGLKEVWGPKNKGPVHLKSTDGMDTFSDSKRFVTRWSEHFQKLLNVRGDINHEALDNIPQRITKTSLNEIPTMDEMAIACLKDGKAPGGDGIPAEIRKHGGDKCIEQDRPLCKVFVDFSKAFNTVGRTGLWQLLRKYGCPEKFTTMIEALHTGMMANVSVGGEVSESFGVTQKWGQARLGTGPHALLHLPISNARRGFPRHGGWRLHTVQTER